MGNPVAGGNAPSRSVQTEERRFRVGGNFIPSLLPLVARPGGLLPPIRRLWRPYSSVENRPLARPVPAISGLTDVMSRIDPRRPVSRLRIIRIICPSHESANSKGYCPAPVNVVLPGGPCSVATMAHSRWLGIRGLVVRVVLYAKTINQFVSGESPAFLDKSTKFNTELGWKLWCEFGHVSRYYTWLPTLWMQSFCPDKLLNLCGPSRCLLYHDSLSSSCRLNALHA